MATPPSSGITFSGGIQISGGFTADGPAVADPYWQYVSYLSQSAEANAAQNNTFLDSSTNNLSITRNGSTTQGSASPFSPDWSNYFNGSTDYLSAASNAAFTFGTGDFTVEAWVYKTASGNAGVFTNGPASSGSFAFYIIANKLQVDFYGGTSLTGATTLANNTWYHIAATRSGTTLRIFLNGVIDASTTSSFNNTSSNCVVGLDWTNSTTYFPGYISNLRVVKGTAVYTANFTPSTNPLFVISGTSILTCQSPAFLDNSINNFALTATGSPSAQRFSPFANFVQTPNTYSTKFNGSTDYLTAPSNAAFALGTVFTVECWVYPTNTTNLFAIGALGIGWNGTSWFGISTVGVSWDIYTTTNLPQQNAWSHVAVVRTGTGTNQTTVYINGVNVAQGTWTNALTTTVVPYIGSSASGVSPLSGYISNVRIVKGTAVYTTTFTPSTTPLTAITNTQLLTCQNATIVDNSTNAFALTVAGTPTPKTYNPLGYTLSSIQTYDTTTYGGSMYFNGSTDYLTAPANAAFNFGTGDFTVEGWVYPTTTSGTRPIVEIRTLAANSTGFALVSPAGLSTLNVYTNGGFAGASTNSVAINQWSHVALVRSGNTWTYWINGISSGSFTNSSTQSDGATTGPKIGGSTTAGELWIGYMSNVRILKGTALYTSNFVPSLTPLSAVTNTSLLLSGTNAGIYDASMINNQITVGDAQSSTSVVKYGSTSMKFDGTGDYLSVVPNVTSSFGTGDFTIESWIYLTSGSTYQFLLGSSDNAAGYMMIGLNVPLSPTSTIAIGRSGINWPVQFGAGTTLTSNTWYHIAITRSGTTNRAFINGTQLGSNVTDSTSWSFPSNAMWIGNQTGGTALNGYLSDFRITKGVARYTSNFTPPTTALPTSGPGPTATSTVEYLVVAGGGGGGGDNRGNRGAGGGGAGGYRTATGFGVTIGTSITVTVGAGGAGGSSAAGTNGSNSVFSTITSTGGGGGAGTDGGGNVVSPGSGGSGGGGGHNTSAGAAGNTPSTSPSQGNNGGTGSSATAYAGGGGGGAGAVGGNASGSAGGLGGTGALSTITTSFVGTASIATSTTLTITVVTAGVIGVGTQVTGSNIPAGTYITALGTGTGGTGTYIMSAASTATTTGVAITSSGVYYAGGGGGHGPGVAGGAGGGGAGATGSATGGAGATNTGGGAGGGSTVGGLGGSGTVIVRYPDNFAPASSTTGSPTVTVAGGYRVYQFTASGSITF